MRQLLVAERLKAQDTLKIERDQAMGQQIMRQRAATLSLEDQVRAMEKQQAKAMAMPIYLALSRKAEQDLAEYRRRLSRIAEEVNFI